MTDSKNSGLQFESASEGHGLLRHFDVQRATWRFPMTGPFWDAVALAHREGRRGAGRRIAIIDGAFDLSLGGLRERAGGAPRLAAPAGADTDHGTAVALLVAAVAPDARLDLYEVAVDGHPGEALIVQALRECVANRVDVINLSIGHNVKDDFASHTCALREAVDEAGGNGALVVASCGNYAGSLGCPAQAGRVLAVGFRTEQRTTVATGDGGATETAEWQAPEKYDQALQPDITLPQPPDVLGSSFAAPLAAALAVLADDPTEITRYRRSAIMGANASQLDAMFGTGTSPLALERQILIGELYQDAVDSLPHPVSMTGTRCPLCAVLAHWILVNAGRYLLGRNLASAETLLQRAEWLAPWSADAVSCLAKLAELKALQIADGSAEARALLSEAETLYMRALQLRPENTAYEAGLRSVRARAVLQP